MPAATFADVDLGDSMTLSAAMSDGSVLPQHPYWPDAAPTAA